MNERPDTPLDRLIAALARKAIAEHLAPAAYEADQEKHAHSRKNSARRKAA